MVGLQKQFEFDAALRVQLQGNLSRFAFEESREDLRHAAVAITLVQSSFDPEFEGLDWSPRQADEAAVILTRRAAGLSKHAGQWALPGGRIDAGESPEQAALRELNEEVGLDLDHASIIGRLDDYTTRSGFKIAPIVVWGGDTALMTPNDAEVASIHRIPVREFMRGDAPILEPIAESEHPVLMMPIGGSWIAAPTAAMLYQFREVALRGLDTRVNHFEQPHFAWR